MKATGCVKRVEIGGKILHICNQRNRDWAHPYDWQSPPTQTLSNAGCGIFSIAHAIEWMCGARVSPDELAEFSCTHGGRGDDGTDRPALLAAMMQCGLGERYQFMYDGDGLRNDLDTLFTHLQNGKGTALCNLRVGHIVTLLKARILDGERQVLAVDSYSESMEPRVCEHVCGCIPGTEIVSDTHNQRGEYIGQTVQYAVYWAVLNAVSDFNLLHNVS